MKAKILEQLKQSPMKVTLLCIRLGVEYRDAEKHLQQLRKDGAIRFDRKIGWQIAPALEGCDRAQTCDEADLYAEAADREKARADAAEAREKELETQSAAMREALRIAIGMLEAGAPAPSHPGPCTPEAGCDGECMSAAHFSQSMQSIRSSLSGDAGRALLERVEAQDRRIAALESVAKAAREFRNAVAPMDYDAAAKALDYHLDALSYLDALEARQ